MNLEFCAGTLRNYIRSGDIFNLDKNHSIYKKVKEEENKEKRIAKHTPPEKSIEFRPEEANNRSAYGHWEGNLVIGKREKGAVLLTLTERLTRQEIIIKLPSKHSEEVARAFNRMERKLGARFYQKFKTITFDNGVEFQKYELIEI